MPQQAATKRAKPGFALFVCLFAWVSAGTACPGPADSTPKQVKRIFDGDTLLLTDGHRVRLAGIDTPELARDRQPAEPFSQAALDQLRLTMENARYRIRLLPARDSKDRYGRLLAHAYSPDGSSIQSQLLRSGLALVNIEPPNLSHLGCYLDAEHEARKRGRGLWRGLPTAARDLKDKQRGLVLIEGSVRNTRLTRHSHWINLQGGVTLRIARSDLEQFADLDFAALPGSRLEARGWLSHYRGRPTLRIHHPAALKPLQ